jgi:protein TonB
MKAKKSRNADLETKTSIFLQIGFIIALGLVFFAFEWSTMDSDYSRYDLPDDVIPAEDIIPVTIQKEAKPKLPPPIKPIDVLIIVEDDTELKETLEIENSEMTEGMDIDFSNIPEVVESSDDNIIFIRVEEMPEFPGGRSALGRYIAENVKYPVIAQENRIQGRVFVTFVVNKKGVVQNVEISRGVDPALDKEALRVISSLPNWKPGKQTGKSVNVRFTVPINFRLQ